MGAIYRCNPADDESDRGKQMKVHVVTQEGHVIGVVNDPATVQLGNQRDIKIEEFELDGLPCIPEGMTPWCVNLDHNGFRTWELKYGYIGEEGPNVWEDGLSHIGGVVLAKNHKEAHGIFMARLAKILE